MTTIEIGSPQQPNRKVYISNQNTGGIYESRLFINDVAGRQHAQHKTVKGAMLWANKLLNNK